MSDKFDQLNLTVGKILNEMKELRDQNQKLFEKNEKFSTEVQQLKRKLTSWTRSHWKMQLKLLVYL